MIKKAVVLFLIFGVLFPPDTFAAYRKTAPISVRPQIGSQPDLVNPITEGLYAVWFFGSAHKIGSKHISTWTRNGAVKSLSFQGGASANPIDTTIGTSSQNDYLDSFSVPASDQLTYSELTVIWGAITNSTQGAAFSGGWNDWWCGEISAGNSMVGEHDGSNGNPHDFIIGTISGATNSGTATTFDTSDNKYHVLASVFSSSKNIHKMYADGIQNSTNTWSATSAITTFMWGSRINVKTQRSIAAKYRWAMIFRRALAPSEIMLLSKDPFIIFSTPVRRSVISQVVAVGGSVTSAYPFLGAFSGAAKSSGSGSFTWVN